MKILLLGKMAAAGKELLKARLAELGLEGEVVPLPEPSAAETSDFKDAAVIVGGPLPARISELAPSLRLFHVFRGGADGLGLEYLPSHVPVVNTYCHENAIAEFTLMAMLVLSRRAFERHEALREGDWRGSAMWAETPEVEELGGKTALIIGLGKIGSEVAKRARAFGMRLVAVSRMTGKPSPLVDETVAYGRWEELLDEADFVIATCRLAENTRGLIGARQLQRMKSSAYLINVARGEVVDESALYEALRTNRIAGVGIDVWYCYPKTRAERCLPSRYPFHELRNVFLSPHCSSWTKQMLAGRICDVAENIRRLSKGASLLNLVPKDAP